MSVAFNSDVTLTVEIGFDSNPLDATQTYSDVSAYARNIEINRGRQHALDDFQTGTCSVVLDNTDDRFNPLNTASPYYDSATGETKVKPFKKIRVSAVYDSTTYRLFTGFVTGYPESFGGQGVDSSVRVQAVDLFKLFNLNTIGSRSWLLGNSSRSLLGTSTKLAYKDEQELSSARINRLLDAFGVPGAERTISTGDLEVQAGVSVNTNLLQALKDVETAEQGQFFIGANGNCIFNPYARLVEFGGYNPYATTIRKSVGSKNFGATATLRVRNPLSRKLWKPQRKEGYFIYPQLETELPKFQADYIKALDKFVDSLYGRAQASRLK
jgi:hypothetical protein